MLNEQQQQLIDKVINTNKKVFMLKGAAGTGKSFTIASLIEQYPNSILLTATTNKAKSLLIESTNKKAFTTHSALGFRMVRNGKEEYLSEVAPAMEADLLIIDEYSMLPQQVWLKALRSNYKKILLVGDETQLPPIGIKAKIESDIEIILTKQMRQVNMEKVEEFLNAFRTAINTKRYIDLNSIALPKEVILYNNHKDFCKEYLKCENNKRILAYSNKVIDSYNLNINQGTKFKVGDLIIMDKPLGNIRNGDFAEIISIEKNHQYFDLVIQNEQKYNIRVFKTKKAEEEWIKESLSKGNMDEYWSRKDFIAHPKHIFASTIHKAQGQSIEEVFIDIEDIFAQTKRRPSKYNNYNNPISLNEYMKLVYVALSRMKIKAHCYIGKKRDYKQLRGENNVRGY